PRSGWDLVLLAPRPRPVRLLSLHCCRATQASSSYDGRPMVCPERAPLRRRRTARSRRLQATEADDCSEVNTMRRGRTALHAHGLVLDLEQALALPVPKQWHV